MSLMNYLHLERVFDRGRRRYVAAGTVPVDWSAVVARAAGAIRAGDIDLAEWLLAEHGQAVRGSAACLNLLAVIAMAGGDWPKAKGLWSRAVRVDWTYWPARNNQRRYFELAALGRSELTLALGDEPAARLPRREAVS